MSLRGHSHGWLTGFGRRVPAKLTYPTYFAMHTLDVDFLTVSMHS
ncbi:hypothetical protein GAR05_01054 [Micromonospora saelicesensis]|uniref:Uncharacterized protein n=1 Tax=Micromonospora saelicesensis TaxID=285676 RepID=A0A1C4ZLG3_9ACTN|nr:hypothetical protein GAR05_01054 [Micromonospora saelicesensis]RAO48458.1 hypothetical protein PSN01_04751 [Micromonospora saelicesensis]RAO52998.1 hypothetical protein LUPAC06_05488 [Micromonospora saelicesensis]SCF33768.1 hypothetical protein GA0070561_5527 [Micromonospora saelicesensis]